MGYFNFWKKIRESRIRNGQIIVNIIKKLFMVNQTLIPIVISKDDQGNSHEEERQRLLETMMNLASKPWVNLLFRLICIVVVISSIPHVFALEHPEDYNRKPNKILMKLYFLKENMHKVNNK